MKIKSFWITSIVFISILTGYILWSLHFTENYFTYLLDDAYIHLAVAKNFALHHVWGITKYQFSSTSSSPLFTFLLSCLISVFGNFELIPLILNIILSIACVYALNVYYAAIFKKSGTIVVAVLFTLFFAVFPMQVLSGMEHVLQVFLMIINMINLRKWWISDFKDNGAAYWFYFTISLMGLVRFESMFYFAALAFCFVLIKQLKCAALTLLLGFLPILIFGYFNYVEGGYFFPNSVLVKGFKPHSGAVVEQLYFFLIKKFFLNPSFYKLIVVPLVFVGYLFYKDYKEHRSLKVVFRKNFLLIAIVLTMIQHTMFADFRGFYRYEAYLMVAFSMVAIPRVSNFFHHFRKAFRQDFFISVLVLSTLVLFIYKNAYAHYMLMYCSKNIYEQQIQSARFLHQYYNNSKVIANDIGAISYFTDIHLLDFVALGSAEMIPFSENGKPFDQEFKNYLTEYGEKNAYDVAIVYDRWLNGQIPDTWTKAADFYISKPNLAAAIDKVSIYAVNPDEYQSLIRNIKHFKWNVNDRVELVGNKNK